MAQFQTRPRPYKNLNVTLEVILLGKFWSSGINRNLNFTVSRLHTEATDSVSGAKWAPLRSRKVRNSRSSALPPTRSLSPADISGNSGLSKEPGGARCRCAGGGNNPCGRRSWWPPRWARRDGDGRSGDGGRGNCGSALSRRLSSGVDGERTRPWRLRFDMPPWPITAHSITS